MEKNNEVSQDRTTINNQAIRYEGGQGKKPLKKKKQLQEEKEQLRRSTNVMMSKRKQRKAKDYSGLQN